MTPNYRPDIDGLRAVAVLFVFCFHSTLLLLPGGFIGVDVFFVISGYLIGRQVIEAAREGRFSFVDFYERRARRLAVPFLIVVGSTYLAALFLLMPNDLMRLSRSIVAAVCFYANIHFYKAIDYFNSDDFLMPLLHLWSLAVEEQFYFVFPLLVVACLRLRSLLRPLIAIAVVSFLACIYATDHNRLAAFYLPHYRMWELLLGVTTYLVQGRATQSTRLFNAVALLGFGLVVVAGLTFGSHTAFPGAAAVLPCAGTALIIWANGGYSRTLVGAFLSTTPLVALGKLSYSFYLWHWPVIVFTQYYLDRKITPFELAILLVVCLGLSAATWFVEDPVRRRRISLFRGETIAASLCASTLLALVALPAIRSAGFPARLPEDARHFAKGASDWTVDQSKCVDRTPDQIAANDTCIFGVGSTVLLWGDSHATAVLPGAKDASLSLHVSLRFIGTNGCPPLLGLEAEKDRCKKINDAVQALVGARLFVAVLIAANWASYGTDNIVGVAGRRLSIEDKELPASLRLTLETISRSGAVPVLIGQTPSYTVDVPAHLAKRSFILPLDSFLGFQRSPGAPRLDPPYLIETVRATGTIAVWPREILCHQRTACRISIGSHSLYRDGGHLAASGSVKILAQPLRELLRSLLDNRETAVPRLIEPR